MIPAVLKPYLAAFQFGFLDAFRDRREAGTSLLIFGCLLLLYYHIYAIMPMEGFEVEGIDVRHFIWYFAITETVIVGTSGLRIFGRLIGEGNFTSLLLRPTHPAFFFIARQTGLHCGVSLILLAFAAVVLPIIGNAPLDLPLPIIPLLLLQIFIAAFMMECIGYLIGTLELLGPYSTPFSWIVGKLIFVFGGLFLPVIFFPTLMREASFLTPFPAILYSPASCALPGGIEGMGSELLRQVLWMVILSLVVLWGNRRSIAYVLEKGSE